MTSPAGGRRPRTETVCRGPTDHGHSSRRIPASRRIPEGPDDPGKRIQTRFRTARRGPGEAATHGGSAGCAPMCPPTSPRPGAACRPVPRITAARAWNSRTRTSPARMTSGQARLAVAQCRSAPSSSLAPATACRRPAWTTAPTAVSGPERPGAALHRPRSRAPQERRAYHAARAEGISTTTLPLDRPASRSVRAWSVAANGTTRSRTGRIIPASISFVIAANWAPFARM